MGDFNIDAHYNPKLVILHDDPPWDETVKYDTDDPRSTHHIATRWGPGLSVGMAVVITLIILLLMAYGAYVLATTNPSGGDKKGAVGGYLVGVVALALRTHRPSR
jgi:hypothetical protein